MLPIREHFLYSFNMIYARRSGTPNLKGTSHLRAVAFKLLPYCRTESALPSAPAKVALPGRSNSSAFLIAANHSIENSPKGFPSVSTQMEQNPYSPMENLDRLTLPPAASIRPSSTLQSWHGKLTYLNSRGSNASN